MAFQKKDVLPAPRVCTRLKSLRENAGVNLDDLAIKTKINRAYLEALEECNFAKLNVSSIYLKNFIRKYAQTLGSDPRPFLDQFTDEELTERERIHVTAPTHQRHRFQFSDIPGAARFAVLGLVVVGLLSYLGLHVHNILKPPPLIVANPTDGYISKENSIAITGSTNPETKIMVNDVPIKNDGMGNFSETITLTPGINTLTIKAENKHGRVSKDIRHVIYKHTESVTLR
jgi:transcriptional regulator with XRE-family HTH domain